MTGRSPLRIKVGGSYGKGWSADDREITPAHKGRVMRMEKKNQEALAGKQGVGARAKGSGKVIAACVLLILLAIAFVWFRTISDSYFESFLMNSDQAEEALSFHDGLMRSEAEEEALLPAQKEWDLVFQSHLWEQADIASSLDGVNLHAAYHDAGSKVTVILLHRFHMRTPAQREDATDVARGLRASRGISPYSMENAAGDYLMGALFGKESAEGKDLPGALFGKENADGNDLSGSVFCEMGINLVLPEARAHGQSGGSFTSYGYLEKQDLADWVAWVDAKLSPGGRVILCGEGMGANAILYASGCGLLPDSVAFAVAESPFASLAEMAEYTLGVYRLPAGIFMPVFRYKLRQSGAGFSLEEAELSKNLAKASLPVIFLGGTADDYIPYEQTLAAYEAYPAEKTLISDHVRHNMAVVTKREELLRAIAAYAQKYCD